MDRLHQNIRVTNKCPTTTRMKRIDNAFRGPIDITQDIVSTRVDAAPQQSSSQPSRSLSRHSVLKVIHR